MSFRCTMFIKIFKSYAQIHQEAEHASSIWGSNPQNDAQSGFVVVITTWQTVQSETKISTYKAKFYV